MPATVTIRYLGDPEKEAHLRVQLEELFKDYVGTWRVKIVSSQENTIWEMVVTGPDDRGQWVYKKFYDEAGERNIEAILTEVRRIAEQIRKETKVTT